MELEDITEERLHAECDRLRARVAELEVALESCVPLAAAWAGYYKSSHDLDDYNEMHKDIVN